MTAVVMSSPTPRPSYAKAFVGVLACCLLIPSAAVDGVADDGAPRYPFPQHFEYRRGTLLPDHVSRARLDGDVRKAYDRWKREYVVQDGSSSTGKLYRIAFGRRGSPEHDQTVSEGQGYGMVIVALMAGHDPAAREVFDGLWRYSREHPSEIDSRLMAWLVPADANGNDSAFDGDADIAYGLLLAAQQWGADGAIDYGNAAAFVLDAIYESTIGQRSKLPLLGDWVDPGGKVYNEYTFRTSDLMLASFDTFWRVTGDARWRRVGRASRRAIRVMQRRFSPRAGLLPEFAEPVSANQTSPRPADPGFLGSEQAGGYSWNACRVPLRIGLNALFNRRSGRLVRIMSTWAEAAHGADPDSIGAGYALDGTPLPDTDYFELAFTAPLGVAAMSSPGQQEWLNDVYSAITSEGSSGYYNDSINLLSLLVMTGNFWDPSRRQWGESRQSISGLYP
jgi:endo-1,4-beta-D-glucanase Y